MRELAEARRLLRAAMELFEPYDDAVLLEPDGSRVTTDARLWFDEARAFLGDIELHHRKKVSDADITALWERLQDVTAICRECGLSRQAVHHRLRKLGLVVGRMRRGRKARAAQTCPVCGGQKSPQARRCRACYGRQRNRPMAARDARIAARYLELRAVMHGWRAAADATAAEFGVGIATVMAAGTEAGKCATS